MLWRFAIPARYRWRNVARIDHSLSKAGSISIAASLPPADANIMRTELRTEAEKVPAAAQADLRLSQEEVRNSLRADPFDPDAMRTAMADNRAAHENFEQVLHDMIASAAAKMSVVGRNKLADLGGSGRERLPTATATERILCGANSSRAAPCLGCDRQQGAFGNRVGERGIAPRFENGVGKLGHGGDEARPASTAPSAASTGALRRKCSGGCTASSENDRPASIAVRHLWSWAT